MRIPKYWAKSTKLPPPPDNPRLVVECWRWSDKNQEDAQKNADARALELTQKFLSGESLNQYWYGERPLREEIIHNIADDAGKETAVVTRNAYGALILNTSSAMFIDVDFPPQSQPTSIGNWLRRLFGKKPPVDVEQQYLDQVRDWAGKQNGLGLKVYRTCAGLRCLVTNQVFEPTHPETIALLGSIGSDPLYVRLCKSQACFRARLTPKPWRCGEPMPPAKYPFAGEAEKSSFDQWLTSYEQTSRNYSVCRPLEHFGDRQVHPEIQPIVDLHDRFACERPDQPLA